MSSRKRKHAQLEEGETETEEEKESNFRTVKLTLKTIVKEEFQDFMREYVFDRSLVISALSHIASLSLLYKVNSALDDERNGRRFFQENNGELLIGHTFREMVRKHVADPNARRMPYGFQRLAEA